MLVPKITKQTSFPDYCLLTRQHDDRERLDGLHRATGFLCSMRRFELEEVGLHDLLERCRGGGRATWLNSSEQATYILSRTKVLNDDRRIEEVDVDAFEQKAEHKCQKRRQTQFLSATTDLFYSPSSSYCTVRDVKPRISYLGEVGRVPKQSTAHRSSRLLRPAPPLSHPKTSPL